MSTASSTVLYGSERELLSPYAAKLLDRGLLKWMIAITASLGAILEIIDTSIVNVALPEIQGNLGATLSEAGWVSTGYACANVVMIPLTAWLSDRFGRKQYLLFSLVGFTLASVMCGLSTSLGMLIVARIFQGLCGGGLLAKAQSLLFETFSHKEIPAAQALFGIGVTAGPAFGPVLGGYITDSFGWRWIFFINLPIGILAVFMTIIFLPRDREETLKHSSVDWLGIGLLTVCLGSFQAFLEEGQQHDWFASDFIRMMAACALGGGILFVWRELTTPHPAVDLHVLRHKALVAGSVYSLVLGMGLYGVMFAVPIFVQNFLQFTPTQAGMLMMPGGLATAFAAVAMSKITPRFDARFLIAVGAVMTACAAFVLARINPDSSADSFFWPLILRAIGTIVMFMPLSLATLGGLPMKDRSPGSGFYSLARQMGSSIGIALITLMLAKREFIHRTMLVEYVSGSNHISNERVQIFSQMFSQHTSDPLRAQLQAYSLLDSIVNGQTTLLSFADVFYYAAFAFLVTLPLLLFLGKGGKTEGVTDLH